MEQDIFQFTTYEQYMIRDVFSFYMKDCDEYHDDEHNIHDENDRHSERIRALFAVFDTRFDLTRLR